MRGSVPKNLLSLWDLLGALPDGDRILDLGCGAGTFDYLCFPQLEIYALDERIDEKVRAFPPHVRFNVGVASAIPVRDSAFAVVIANFVFEHVPDAPAALSEIDRVTRDGGYVWISIPNAASFEDQLYRNLFAGGGHLQQPTFEWFLRQTYENTSLKVVAYADLPAAFTYLGESEELRHLTWALVDSLRRTVGVDARAHSGWVFVLQKLSSLGPGFREYLRSCSRCGSPDEMAMPGSTGESISTSWECSKCGEWNSSPSSIQAVSIDEVDRGLRLQWERYPETRPQRLRELLEEKARWGRGLEELLKEARERYIKLKAEFDERGRWAQELDKEIHAQREYIEKLEDDALKLKAEFDERGRWAQELDKEIHARREYIEKLNRNARLPARLLKQFWRQFRRIT